MLRGLTLPRAGLAAVLRGFALTSLSLFAILKRAAVPPRSQPYGELWGDAQLLGELRAGLTSKQGISLYSGGPLGFRN